MTSDKKLKRVVRKRVAKTGERYASARRVVTGTAPDAGWPDPRILAGYTRVGGPILQLPALADALAARGAVAPHTGRLFDELRERIEAIHRDEVAATEAIHAIVGD